jgi:hypothetical protein
MELETLRRCRRISSAVVMLSAIALVMAKVSGSDRGSSQAVGSYASLAFVISLLLLVLVWRKEHAANEAAFAARAREQLAIMKLQLELAKKKQAARPEANGADSSFDTARK